MKIGIIGLGLMGGSFSIEMRRLFPNSLVLGNDISQINITKSTPSRTNTTYVES